MSGSATKSEKFKAAFGVISKNVLADKKKQVGDLLDTLDTELADLEESTRKAQLAYHPGKKGVAEKYKPLRERLTAVDTSGLSDKDAFKEYERIESQAKAALKSVPALKNAAEKQKKFNDMTKDDIDKEVAKLGDKVTSPEDQGTMIAAIKARYGIDELAGELTSNALPRLYKALKLVPENHTKNNPMLQVITRSKMSDTSLYSNGTININGGQAGPHTTEREKYSDGAGKTMKFNKFDAHTLHEVGHSVDDASGYMAHHGKDPAYGGWIPSSAGAAIVAAVDRFGADWKKFGPQALRLVAAEAIRSGAVQGAIDKMTKLKNDYKGLDRATLLKDPAVVAGDKELEDILDEFDLPLDQNGRAELNKRMALNKLGSMIKVPDKNVGFVVQFLLDMQAYLIRAEDLAKQYETAFQAVEDPKALAKLAGDVLKWAKLITKELWWKSSSDIEGVAINGTVYQQDGTSWWQYALSARDRMVKDYQFRSPAEWFAEVYTVAMLGKLSSSHPCADDIKTIDTTKKLGT